MEQRLEEFAAILDADEVLLFERATFLVIAKAQLTAHKDVHRFEKVSNIIKQFKLSCRYVYIFAHSTFIHIYSKLGSQFECMEVRNNNFAAFIDSFTSNTYMMLVLSDGSVCKCLFL
jgi:Ras-related GTP-binding protein A/B